MKNNITNIQQLSKQFMSLLQTRKKLLLSNDKPQIKQQTVRYIENLTEQRSYKLKDGPNNICAYICALELAMESKELKYLGLRKNKLPQLTAMLKSKISDNGNRIVGAILEIIKEGQQIGIDLIQCQDPFLISSVIRQTLHKYGAEDFVTIPIQQYKCVCSQENKTMVGDFQYNWNNTNESFQRAKIKCPDCGTEMVITGVSKLPPTIITRLNGKKCFGPFDQFKIPNIKDYRPNAYIMVNSNRTHFKMIRSIGKNYSLVFDDDKVEAINHSINQLIYSREEDIYMIQYSLINNTKLEQIPEKLRNNHIIKFDRIFCGGSKRNKNNNNKMQLQNEEQSQIISMKQSQQEHQEHQEIQQDQKKQQQTQQKVTQSFLRQQKQKNKQKQKLKQKQKTVKNPGYVDHEQKRNVRRSQGLVKQMIIRRLNISLSNYQITAKENPQNVILQGIYKKVQTILEKVMSEEIQTDKNFMMRLNRIDQDYWQQISCINLQNNKNSQTKQDNDDPFNHIFGTQERNKSGNNKLNRGNGRDLPQNSCAYVAALDLIKITNWMEYCNAQHQIWPQFISFFANSNNTRKACEQIYKLSKGELKELGQYEDPWMVINMIQKLAIKQCKMKKQRQQPVFTVSKCKCGVLIHGNLQFELGTGQYSLKINSCPACSNKNPITIVYQPEQIIVRLDLPNDKKRGYKTPNLPFMKNRYPGAVIQYSNSRRHFRVVKTQKNLLKVIDGNSIQQYRSNSERQYILYGQDDWLNYIVAYSKGRNVEPEKFIKQNEVSVFTLWINDYKIKAQGKATVKTKKTNRQLREQMIKVRNSMPKIKGKGVILTWNISSMIHPKKMLLTQIMRKLNPMIAFITEPRGIYQKYKYTTQSSLTAEGVNKKINCNLLIHESISYNIKSKQTDYVSIVAHDNEIFTIPTLIVCVYMNPSPHKKTQKQLTEQKLYQQMTNFSIQHMNQQFNIIIGGDFNYTINEMEKISATTQVYQILRSMSRSIYTSGTSRRSKKEIDYIFSLEEIQTVDINNEDVYLVFDHKPVITKIKVNIPKYEFLVPNTKLSKEIVEEVLKQQQPSINTLEQILKRYESNLLIQKSTEPEWAKITQYKIENLFKPEEIEGIMHKMTQKMNKITNDMFSASKGKGFKALKKWTKYDQFQKRQGGIITKAVVDGRIVRGKQLQQQLSTHYSELHNTTTNVEKVDFPELEVTIEQIVQIMKGINKGKGISFDGVSDQLLTLCNKCYKQPNSLCERCSKKAKIGMSILNNKQYMNSQQGKNHLIGRLVPLNKQHPKTPQIKQYRAIVVASVIKKLVQGYIKIKLNEYDKKLQKSQYGFRKGISIEQCKLKVIQQIKKRKKNNENTSLQFFDLSSAYDLVDRKILMKIVKQNKILDQKRIQVSKFLFTNSATRYGETIIQLANGVEQGSIIAPQYFNIYVQPLSLLLQKRYIKHYFFADDILIIGNKRDQMVAGKIIKEWQGENNMIINHKKCGLMIINGNQRYSGGILGVQEVGNYKYLGMNINGKLDATYHLQIIKKKINFIKYKLYAFRKRLSIRTNIQLFKTFIMPLYRLAIPLYAEGDQKTKKSIIMNIKKELKLFCLMPMNTPNATLRLLAGDLQYNIQQQIKKISKKLAKHLGEHIIQEIPEEERNMDYIKGVKHFPLHFTQMLRKIYHSKCNSHYGITLTTTHMRQQHSDRWRQLLNDDRTTSTATLLANYQNPKLRKIVRTQIGHIRRLVEQIKTAPGAARGRRW